jgi:hypothetical protein
MIMILTLQCPIFFGKAIMASVVVGCRKGQAKTYGRPQGGKGQTGKAAGTAISRTEGLRGMVRSGQDFDQTFLA